MPLGGVGRAGVGTGTGTKAGRNEVETGWAMNGAGWATCGAGGAAGDVATGNGGADSSGALEAGVGSPAGSCSGVAGSEVFLCGFFSFLVPHGWRTLPPSTCTSSEKLFPPVLSVTLVSPWL